MQVDLEFLGRQTERILAELRDIREDLAGVKTRLTAPRSAFDLSVPENNKPAESQASSDRRREVVPVDRE